MTDPDPVLTTRLRLEALPPETLDALVAGDLDGARRRQGIEIPDGFFGPGDDVFLKIQLARMAARPSGRGWCARAMVRVEDGAVIGHCGFHGPPPDVGRAEIGYCVLAPYRRQGYAVEAVHGLLTWASSQGETVVFASVAPTNEASLAVMRTLGFRQTGVQIDEIDGEEGVFEISLD